MINRVFLIRIVRDTKMSKKSIDKIHLKEYSNVAVAEIIRVHLHSICTLKKIIIGKFRKGRSEVQEA